MKDKDIVTIVCPTCGAHFLPSEVFMPNSFFGKQTDIKRQPDGTIDYYIGEDPDMTEEYVCDNCLSKLKIKANLSFDVQVVNGENFDEDYTTEINKPAKIKLLEEADLF